MQAHDEVRKTISALRTREQEACARKAKICKRTQRECRGLECRFHKLVVRLQQTAGTSLPRHDESADVEEAREQLRDTLRRIRSKRGVRR